MDEAKWPLIPGAPSYGQGRDHPGPRYTSLIHGEHLTNVRVRGDGPSSILDGQGWYWWGRHERRQERFTRGHLVELMYSSDIEVADLMMRNSPFWNNHFFDCIGVHVHGVSIYAPDNLTLMVSNAHIPIQFARKLNMIPMQAGIQIVHRMY
jgi:polygalacturonase